LGNKVLLYLTPKLLIHFLSKVFLKPILTESAEVLITNSELPRKAEKLLRDGDMASEKIALHVNDYPTGNLRGGLSITSGDISEFSRILREYFFRRFTLWKIRGSFTIVRFGESHPQTQKGF
jgi:hypothetical protein